MAAKKTEPDPEPGAASGIKLWKFAVPYPVHDLGQASTMVVGGTVSGGVVNGVVESIYAFPEGVLVTVAQGVHGLEDPNLKAAERRRLLFTASGHGHVGDA